MILIALKKIHKEIHSVVTFMVKNLQRKLTKIVLLTPC